MGGRGRPEEGGDRRSLLLSPSPCGSAPASSAGRPPRPEPRGRSLGGAQSEICPSAGPGRCRRAPPCSHRRLFLRCCCCCCWRLSSSAPWALAGRRPPTPPRKVHPPPAPRTSSTLLLLFLHVSIPHHSRVRTPSPSGILARSHFTTPDLLSVTPHHHQDPSPLPHVATLHCCSVTPNYLLSPTSLSGPHITTAPPFRGPPCCSDGLVWASSHSAPVPHPNHRTL